MSVISRRLMLNGRAFPLDLLFVASATDDIIHELNAANPEDLFVLDEIERTAGDLTYGVAVDATNRVAYLAASTADSITAISFATAGTMAVLDTFTSTELDRATVVAVDEASEVAFVVTNSSRIVAIDISDPSNMSQLGYLSHANLDTPVSMELDLVNDIAYIGTEDFGLTAINIATPASMAYLGNITTVASRETFIALDVANDVAFAGVRASRLQAIDISDPTAMSLISEVTDGIDAVALDLENEVIFALDKSADSIIAYNVANTGAMVEISRYTSFTDFNMPDRIVLDVNESVAYCTVDENDIVTIDVSDTSDMVIAGTASNVGTFDLLNNIVLYKGEV